MCQAWTTQNKILDFLDLYEKRQQTMNEQN